MQYAATPNEKENEKSFNIYIILSAQSALLFSNHKDHKNTARQKKMRGLSY